MIEVRKNKHPSTKWEQVKEDIEVKIINGVYHGNERLPSSADLKNIYNVGKSTTDIVLRALEKEGTIYVIKGVGSFVTPQKQDELRDKYIRIIENRVNELIVLSEDIKFDLKAFVKSIY